MPELPDAEVFRRRLARKGLRRRIRRVQAPDDRLLEDVSASTLQRRLKGDALASTRRHGKYVFAELDRGDAWLLLHFGMTGALDVLGADAEPPKHLKLRLDFDGGDYLAYTNQRTFGKIGLIEDPDGYIEERRLGPDPLEDDVGFIEFRERIQRRKASIKVVLMDQSVLAGLGNVYVDEILFQVGLHPQASADRLREETVKSLHGAVRKVLTGAIKAGADPASMPDDWLLPHRRKGGECPRCGRALRKEEIGGRSTYYCAREQSRKT